MSPLPEQPLSPLDGRYRLAVAALGDHLSEAGLNRARVRVEIEWLLYLTDRELFGSARLDHEQTRRLREFAADFGEPHRHVLELIDAPRETFRGLEVLLGAGLGEGRT